MIYEYDAGVELLQFERLLTREEWLLLDAYLMEKWGVHAPAPRVREEEPDNG